MPDVIHSFPTWLPKTQTWMYNQAAFLPSDWNCRVVCSATDNLDQFRLPYIHSCQQRPIGKYLHLLAERLGYQPRQKLLGRVIKQYRVGLVHSHFGHIGWADADTVQRHGALQVVTFYGQDVSRLPAVEPIWYQRYIAMFRKAAAVLCEGEEMAKSVAALGCPKQKIRVQRLGVDLAQIRFVPRRWLQGPLRILIAASFQEKKGIPYALEALGRLKHEIDFCVTIIGDSTKEPRSQVEKATIIRTISKYEMGDRVTMLGFQPHARMLAEAETCHVFLSPSIVSSDGDSEGGAPVSIIEMAAAGMIVVSTIHKDIPSVIRNRETGFLAEERSVQQLIEIIRSVCREPQAWRSMQERGRRHIMERFDACTQGKRLAKIYSELLQSASGGGGSAT